MIAITYPLSKVTVGCQLQLNEQLFDKDFQRLSVQVASWKIKIKMPKSVTDTAICDRLARASKMNPTPAPFYNRATCFVLAAWFLQKPRSDPATCVCGAQNVLPCCRNHTPECSLRMMDKLFVKIIRDFAN